MSKTPIILLHGALGSREQLEPLRLLFSHTPALSMNFSGHGGLPLEQAEYGITRFAEDVITFLNEHGLDAVNIFGYSMGGYVALKLAQLHPGRVNRIFTLGTKFHWTPESAAQECKQLDPEKIVEKVPQFARVLEERHKPEDWKQVLSKTAQMMHALAHGDALTKNDLGSITHPVVIGIGSLDVMVSLQESQAAAETLPNGSLEIFDGFKHPIEQVDTGRLLRSISTFFDR